MAVQPVREWTGIKQFPIATQNALLNSLGVLKQENIDSLTILVLGKGGVGKSSTVNSILGERVTTVNAFQPEVMRPMICSRSRAGFTINIVDTPGLVEGGFVNDHALDLIKRFLINKSVDVMLYVDRLDNYRVDTLDGQVVKAISSAFGKNIWKKAILTMTHAQLSPPDGLSYTNFVGKRAESLQRMVYQRAGIKKSEKQIPVVLVENSGRCSTNDGGEKVLPDGTVWLPTLVNQIVEVATNGASSILVNQKLIDGSDADNWGKRWIPLVLLVQYLFFMKPIKSAIQRDIQQESKFVPHWKRDLD